MIKKLLGWFAWSVATSAIAFAGNGSPSPTSQGATEVTVPQPIDGSTIGSSVPVVASASSPYGPIAAMVINVDSQDVYKVSGASINTHINMGAGGHQIYVKAWDTKGHYFDDVLHITVSGSGPAPQPGGVTTIGGIEKMSGWQSCDVCAGPGGAGHTVPHGIVQHVASPSLDGNATEYWLGGGYPYSNVLNFKPLGGVNGASNFTLSFDFWIGDATVAQGLEMDIFYARNGKKNYFLTECDSRGTYAGTWQVSNVVIDQWQHTGLPCKINSYAWNHVTMQFLRQSDGNTRFVSVSMNGNMQYVNRTYTAPNDGSFQMNAAIQMDGDSKQDPWKIFVDNMTIKYW